MTVELPEFIPASVVNESSRLAVTRGDPVFRVGEPTTHVHFVIHGELLALRYLSDGSEAVMQRAREGEFFAQSAMFVAHYSCDARAAATTEVVRIPVDTLRRALVSDGNFALAFASQLAADLRRQCSRVERLHIRRARDRVQHYLVCEGIPQGRGSTLKMWAQELGLAPETLSRALADMELAGEIQRDSAGVSSIRSTPPAVAPPG